MTTHDYPKYHILETIRKYTIGDGLDIVVDHDRSQGSWVFDQLSRRQLLDCYSQFASQPLGWNHPILVRATEHLGTVAIQKIANSDMYCEEYGHFVDAFAQIAPDFQHFFFVDGGALAVENSIKAAWDWKMQKLGYRDDFMANHLDVIHLEHAFHGRSGYTLSLTNTGPMKTWGFPKFNWTRLASPMKNRQAHTLSLAQAETAMKRGNVAAVIVEPIQGEGGDIHLPGDYLHDLWSLAQKHDALFIVDEVQTGVGLTGKMWAYEHFKTRGFMPDLLCFGKKCQTCGFAAGKKIDEVENNVFKRSSRINSTWGGNIVDMVRFLYIQQAIREEDLITNAKNVGEYVLEQLQASNLFENARGRGLMIAFDLPTPEARDAYLQRLSKNMLALKCGDRSIRLRPHLTFSKEDADKAMEFIIEAARN